MRKTPVLVTVFLALAVFSSANTINLTSGSGKLYPFGVAPGFTFLFYGGGYGIAIPSAWDDPQGQLWGCTGCDPFQLGPDLFFYEGTLTPDKQFVSGIIQFDAVSFVSSLAPSGVLTIKYTADAYLYLFLGNQQTSEGTGPFVWGNPNQPWYITAQFKPDSGYPGIYTFAGATFSSSSTPIPEPATLMLLGTGMCPILFAVRRRLYRTNRTKVLTNGPLPSGRA